MKKEERNARAEMEVARQKSEKQFSPDQRLPRRYKMYDKIKDRVSLRTVDTVIVVTAVLIVALLVIGMATGKR